MGDWIQVLWVKLEEGIAATPWLTPDPQQELARCSRYCHVIRADGATPSQVAGIGMVDTPTLAAVQVAIPSMRVVPAFSYTGNWSLRVGGGRHDGAVLAARPSWHTDPHALTYSLGVTVASASLVPGQAVYLVASQTGPATIILDAEI